jgi:hypothetical protein
MKNFKLILVVLFTFLFLNANAQVFIGGDFGISSSSYKTLSDNSTEYKQSGFGYSLSPLFGKFLTDKIALGILADIASGSSKLATDDTHSSKSFGVGAYPFVRYYIIQWNKFSVFGMGTAGIGYSKSKSYTDGIIESKNSGLSYSIDFHPGISYTLSDKFSLETEIGLLRLGYVYYSSKSGPTEYHSSNFDFSGNLNLGGLSFGVIYKFNNN